MPKKVLHQVDLSSIAKPVKPKKKKVVEPVEPVEEPVEEPKQYATKSLPVKEKKPPTEKQLAARAKLKAAREKKLADDKAEKERIETEIKAKEEELARKKAEQAEKRRLKREEKKANAPLKPVVVSQVAVQPEEPEVKLKLDDVIPKKVDTAYTSTVGGRPEKIYLAEHAAEPRPRIVHPEQRKRYYPFGLSVPVNKRMR
jgi:type IV secretory pathway VirB10-like protein